MNDLFLKIIAGEIPSEKIYEDEHVYAFLDIRPTVTGHTLVVPKKYSRNIFDANDETLSRTIIGVKKVAEAVKRAMGADGINIISNNEPAAGQLVFHLHFHVIPRYKNDGLEPWHGKEMPPEKLSEVGKKIRGEL